jgi:hypothetical protein
MRAHVRNRWATGGVDGIGKPAGCRSIDQVSLLK